MIPGLTGAMLAAGVTGGVSFPVVRTFIAGSSVDTAPTGAVGATIEVWGGGGAGGRQSGLLGGGGGGGGYTKRSVAVIGGDTLTYSVAGVASGRDTNGPGGLGKASSVTGSVSGGSVSMFANGGGGGTVFGSESIGGSASGGDVNLTGGINAGAIGGNSAAYPDLGGGAGGGENQDGFAPGGGGGGADGGFSGDGARGQVRFTYYNA
jgi:hypothetical protein